MGQKPENFPTYPTFLCSLHLTYPDTSYIYMIHIILVSQSPCCSVVNLLIWDYSNMALLCRWDNEPIQSIHSSLEMYILHLLTHNLFRLEITTDNFFTKSDYQLLHTQFFKSQTWINFNVIFMMYTLDLNSSLPNERGKKFRMQYKPSMSMT